MDPKRIIESVKRKKKDAKNQEFCWSEFNDDVVILATRSPFESTMGNDLSFLDSLKTSRSSR